MLLILRCACVQGHLLDKVQLDLLDQLVARVVHLDVDLHHLAADKARLVDRHIGCDWGALEAEYPKRFFLETREMLHMPGERNSGSENAFFWFEKKFASKKFLFPHKIWVTKNFEGLKILVHKKI